MTKPQPHGARGPQWIFLGCCALASSACGPGNWSVESDPVASSLTLLEGDTEIELVLVARTSHRGRINTFVNLPGEATEDADSEPRKLIVAELILDDAHSLVTLPGTGGGLSVNCPGERCSGDEARFNVRVLDGAELPSSGLFVEWEARAETFGEGADAPQDAEAILRLER